MTNPTSTRHVCAARSARARSWAAHTAFAVVATLALAAAPAAYDLTACGPEHGIGDRLGWALVTIVVLALSFPGWVAAGAAAVFGTVLVASRNAASIRLRNRIVPALFAAVVVTALAIGAFVPTRCSIF